MSGSRVKFVAEVSSNHNQDLNRCLKFIDIASEIGCDAVKFQLFKVDQLFAPEILRESRKHRERKKWELPLEYIPILSNRAKEKAIEFSCTPFYIEAVNELLPYVDFYKIASYELLWHDLISACAQTDKPLVLSTGMSVIDEVFSAVSCFNKSGGKNLTLLHCVSRYPAQVDECNLVAIEQMRNLFSCNVGWSDHSVQTSVVNRAVHRWGASMIEFHLDIEGRGVEFNSGHCWLPQKIATLIEEVRYAEKADGDITQHPVKSEIAERVWRADPSDGLRPLLSQRSSFHV